MKITKEQLKQIIKEEVSDACENLVDGIHGLVKDIDPNEVSEIFASVFEKLPGVELEYDEDTPDEEVPGRPIGFGRQPEMASAEERETERIGFEEQLIHMIREIRGHGSPKNLSKHFGPETLRKAGVKGAPEQDLEIQLRDEMDKQLIEILGKTLEEATYALDSYDASDYIPGIIRNLETALAVLEGGDV